MIYPIFYFSRLSAFFISAFCVFLMFFLQIIGVIFATKIHLDTEKEIINLIEIGSKNGIVVACSIIFTAIFLSSFAFLIIFIKSSYHINKTLAYFDIKKFSLKSFFVYLLYLIIFLIISEGLLFYFDSKPLTLMDGLMDDASFLPMILTTTIIAPIYEELIFRGMIFGVYSNHEINQQSFLGLDSSHWTGVIISSLLFVFVHALQYDLLSTVIIFFLAILFCHARIKQGILLSVVLHIINNTLAMAMYLLGY